MKASILAIILAIGAASSASAEATSDPYSNGGPINAPAIVAHFNKSGETFRIKGYCKSSCTMLLAIKSACVEPSATLAFHAAIFSPNQPVSPERNRQMASYYKPALRKYLLDNHYMDSWTLHTISGEELIRTFGYRACQS